jgi:hypothetical protein
MADLDSGMTRKQVKLAIPASHPHPQLIATGANSGVTSRIRASNNESALVGTNPGDWPGPESYLDGCAEGIALEGASAGQGPVPNGYLDGYAQGTAVAGGDPGEGLEPSGYMGGSFHEELPTDVRKRRLNPSTPRGLHGPGHRSP